MWFPAAPTPGLTHGPRGVLSMRTSSRQKAPHCAICLGVLETRASLRSATGSRTCRHGFHRVCILKWAITNPHCPCCRTPFFCVGTGAASIKVGHEQPPPAPRDARRSTRLQASQSSAAQVIHGYSQVRTHTDLCGPLSPRRLCVRFYNSRPSPKKRPEESLAVSPYLRALKPNSHPLANGIF